MKNFTVKEVAELLETNPETVRRWIRSGKLAASQGKKGSVITETMLATPKYASGKVLDNLGLTSGSLAMISALDFLGKANMPKEEVEEMLIEAITLRREEIRIFQKEITRLQLDMEERENYIKRAENLLMGLSAQ